MTSTKAAMVMYATGQSVTMAAADTGIYWQLCHGDKVVRLNANGSDNNITAWIEKIETVEQFVITMKDWEFKLYERL